VLKRLGVEGLMSGVHGMGIRAGKRVFEKNMTAACPIDREAGFFEGAENLSSLSSLLLAWGRREPKGMRPHLAQRLRAWHPPR
jgi:hypothetical protein